YSAGVSWVGHSAISGKSWRSVTYGNGLFVAVALNGGTSAVMTSPDGVNWTSRTTPSNNNLRMVRYGNGLFVAVGSGTAGMISVDGINWTTITTPNQSWRALTYGN